MIFSAFIKFTSVIAFSSVCLSAMPQDHFQCVEHGCRHSNADSIQNNIVYVKAAAKDWLQQLNSQCSQKAGDQGPHPCAVLLEQRVEDAKGEKHHDIAQVLRSEVVEKVGDKIILKSEPVMVASAGRMVEEKIVDVPNKAVEKRQAQEPCNIADEKRREDNFAGGTPPVSPDLTSRVDSPGNQRNRKRLQKVAWICVEKEILKIHIAWKVHTEALTPAYSMNEI